MDYQNTDEAIRREACERVKQIVKAIKAIKIKYYSIFTKISPQDKEKYQKLENALNKISDEHDLNNLKVALMQEVEARYNGQSPEDMKQGQQPQPDDILQACYGAVDAEIDALSRGRITQAIRCQEQLKKYRQQLDDINDKEIKNYKREKLAELGITREQVEEQIKLWKNDIKGMFKIKHAKAREEMVEIMESLSSKEKEENRTDEEVTI